MKALTVKQPYASQIISGEKTIEWRAAPVGYRGRLAIHAAREPAHPTLPTGVIIGEVTLVHCEYRADAPYRQWPYAWHLAEPAEWDPIPAVGNLNLWNLETGIRRQRELDNQPNLFGWVMF